MKRSTVLVLTGVMTMCLAACGGEQPKPTIPPTTTPIIENNNVEKKPDTTNRPEVNTDVHADAGTDLGTALGMGSAHESDDNDTMPAPGESAPTAPADEGAHLDDAPAGA